MNARHGMASVSKLHVLQPLGMRISYQNLLCVSEVAIVVLWHWSGSPGVSTTGSDVYV